MDLKVPAVGGSQWTTAERQREEKSLCGNHLQTLLDFCGSPQNDAVERVKGIEPSYAAWEATVLPLNYTRLFVSEEDEMGMLPLQDTSTPLFRYDRTENCSDPIIITRHSRITLFSDYESFGKTRC